MAVTALTSVATYVNGADLTGFSNKVEFGGEADDLDKTTFGSGGWKEHAGGLFDGHVMVSGFWDAGDNTKPDDVLFGNLGTNLPVSMAWPDAATMSNLSYLTRAVDLNYSTFDAVGALMPYSAELRTDRPITRGQVMHPSGTARTSTGTGTIVQLGAVSATQKLRANLHVLSVSGTAVPTLTVKMQSAALVGFGSPTDRITFTAATAISGEHNQVTGAITDQFWRASWTISGTNPSFLFVVTAGISTI